MATSTFSCVAMSPPLLGRDVRHVGDAERLVALLCAVHDVDGVAAHEEIDEAAGRSLPAVVSVLPHEVDEIALLDGRELGELAAVQALAAPVDRADRGAIEVGV